MHYPKEDDGEHYTACLLIKGLRDIEPRILYPKEESGSHCLLILDLKPHSAGLKNGSTINAADFRDRYLCVVDVGGRGLKSDWSVIAVFDRMPMASGEGPEVVAQWRGHVDFDILAEKAAMISAFYGNALLVIESNTIETRERERDTDGYQAPYLFTSLRDRYPNLYMRTRSDEYVFTGSPSRYGFHTNAATKPMVISNLVRMIREGLYVERDFGCIDEYLAYERRQNGSYGALAGFHDDILMTRAIGLHICFNEMSLPRHTEHRQPSRINRRRNPLTESSF